MDLFPDFVDKSDVDPSRFSIKIESHRKQELRLFCFIFFGDGGPDVHGEKTDGIAPMAVEKQVPGIIVRNAGDMLELFCIKTKKRFELFESQKVNPNFFELTIQTIDGRDMIGPATGIPIPKEQFFEYMPDRDLYTDFVDV
jgi:hypothetical protein